MRLLAVAGGSKVVFLQLSPFINSLDNACAPLMSPEILDK